MKLAFVYAGQGSQFAGMGKDLYENYPAARAVFDQFPADFDLRTTCFEDPEGLLNQTRYTQPCMLAVAMAITDILAENGITPEMTAGLSLGEYSALYCADVLDRQTAAELITFRGQAMQKASEGVESSMTAILGLDRELVQKAGALQERPFRRDEDPGGLQLSGTGKDCRGIHSRAAGASGAEPGLLLGQH